ncbi:MAG: aldose 1-epimerase family protein [Planctomycetes bacterium]|nr:aldose 1-epimerase family protein [Planctomycetota bacterium]
MTTFDTDKFENVHQVGGITTATLDHPGLGGVTRGTRVAFVNTGAGLRFTVALDRGGDIVDASFNQHSLAYLSPNGMRPPSHAYHHGLDWLRGWAGGLVTTCGPQYIGGPREEDGATTSLHGHHSNSPAAVEMILNPDPHRGRREMLLSMVVRDSRMFGPVVEVRRQIQCALGVPEIIIHDHVTNRGNTRCAHHWLYHVNLGYPLLDRGAKHIYRGPAEFWEMPAPPGESIIRRIGQAAMNRIKTATGPLDAHRGSGERGLIVRVKPARDGMCHVGLVNAKLNLGFELIYPAKALPRLANWQHFGPGGSYVSGIEPFSGSLLGKARDKFPGAEQYLEPGESRRYQLTIRVHNDKAGIKGLMSHDGEVSEI